MADVTAGGANIHMELRGAKELAKGLRKAGANMKDLRAANKQAAQVVAPEAKSLAPRRSGRLSASVRAGATQKAGVVRAGSKRVPYAGPINYGWSRRHIKPTRFMNTAAKNTEPEWTKVYRDAVQKIIDRIITGDTSA